MKQLISALALALLFAFSSHLSAQEDLMSMLEDEADANDDSRVYATLKP